MDCRSDDFCVLMEGIRAGSEEAAKTLLDHYGPGILRAVRRGLNRRMRSQFDSRDFVQEVWAAFFACPPPAGEVDRPQKLTAFLTRVANNKIIDATRRRLKGQKRNLNRELSLEDLKVDQPQQLVAQQPTPSEVVRKREEWDLLLDEQPLVYRRILLLLRDRRTPTEIAAELGIHPRTVLRFVTKLLLRAKS
jgi:RNA polymerase sigma factor (sigma-70 family)